MAVQIKFDGSHNPISPTIVLATRNGRKLGKIPAQNVVLKASMHSDDISFKVDKEDCGSQWDLITDFKLVWVREWNRWFEIYVEIDDTIRTVKSVTAVSLGKAELSQINLYDKQINTEDDISREDYKPTVFYNPGDSSTSLLDRLIEKAPHYTIGKISSSLQNIQRTFSFDKKSIYDALNEVAEEIECLIDIECSTGSDGVLVRKINAYDLKQVCAECGERGDFTDTCSKCGSANILPGYGKDTTIYITTENLAENINYSTDTGSVKNCFKLEAGDDLMTAAIVACNPNGSGYIWYISDETKKDMSRELVEKLGEYDETYRFYMKENVVVVPDGILVRYNDLIDKYRVFTKDYRHAAKQIIGYPALMERYFDTIDFGLYLSDRLMPDVKMSDTNAHDQISKIISYLLEPVAVKDLENCSTATADSAVLGVAKAVCDTRYTVRIVSSAFGDGTWRGIISATNEADESDTYTSSEFTCLVNDEYETYVKQKILKSMKKTCDDAVSLENMFTLSEDAFADELKKYCLTSLSSYHEACQTCVDILIEQGIADPNKWKYRNDDLYNKLYLPYYNKLMLIDKEMALRESEIAIVCGDGNGTDGMQTTLGRNKDAIQSLLNLEHFLGDDEYRELSSYRREDTYNNSNYISDGLDNAELFQMAMTFIEVAQSDIFKSATLQHSITAKLKNLLGMKEFSPIIDSFEIGNWIRVRTDGRLCKLRLIEYEIDFDNFDDISVEFSDLVTSKDSVSDVESVISQASSMASSYDVVARQAKKGSKSNEELADWVDRGLSLTKLKIIDSADNQNISWDSHGLLCKEYLPTLNAYDDRQLKIISRGLYLTDDGWKSSKAGIGDFTYWNPKTGKMEESYGLIADAIVGNIILSEEVGIYNQKNSLSVDQNGICLTAFKEKGQKKPSTTFKIRKKEINADTLEEEYTDLLYQDDDGNLVINGSVRINSSQNPESSKTLDNIGNDVEEIQDRIDGFNGLFFYVRYSANENGEPMSSAPDSTTQYIGTCNTDAKVAPSDPKSYTWVKIKGEQGIQGVDGSSSYLHIRYSNDGKTFTGNGGLDDGDWIGTSITKSPDAPTDFSAYKWSRFNGIDGINTAYIMLYKRDSVKPGRIKSDLQYEFADGHLSGDLEGWSQHIPDSDGCPCYVIHAMASSRESVDTITAKEWTEPEKLVEDGTPGTNGYNSATVYLYRRSNEQVSIDWTDDLTYSFELKRITNVPNGWHTVIPDGESPIYVTAATVTSASNTGTIAWNEWSDPVILAQNGADGRDGANGKDGINGLNTATMFLYKRSASVPGKPSTETIYTFETGSLTGLLASDGWSMSVPDGDNPCYMIHATAVSNTASDIIKSTEWSDPVVFSRNGKDGVKGGDGYNTASVYLYARSKSSPSIDWKDTLTYTFSTKKLSQVPAGWSQSIPSGSDPIYVTIAGAYSNTNTDTITWTEWSDPVVLAQNGADGKDGTNGKDGINGTSSYFHVRYSAYSDGKNMSDTPTSTTSYIGVCSSNSSTAPTNVDAYKWSRFRGYNGSPGKAGADGRTQYLHIKYSNDGNSFTGNDGEDVGSYIGTLVDFNQDDSIDFNAYTWKKFSGDIDADISGILDKINGVDSKCDDINDALDSYKSEVGQYMTFAGSNGLVIGASQNGAESKFKTVIDNQGMYFKQRDVTVSYIQNESLNINKATIRRQMQIGNFLFQPRTEAASGEDVPSGSVGSFSIVWVDDV